MQSHSQAVKDHCRRLRYEVLSYYAGEQPKCQKCGFSDIRALCIDHIPGGGNKHREEVGGTSISMYRWIKKNNFPPYFQVLCHNCNFIKVLEQRENKYAPVFDEKPRCRITD